MYPQIYLPWGDGIPLGSYRLFMLLFALAVSLGAYLLGRQRGLNAGRLLILIVIVDLSGLLGSRLLYLLSQGGLAALSSDSLFDMHFRYFSVYGGLVMASLLGFIACVIMRLNPWIVADAFTPGLGVGLGFAKIGCFLNGCCFGSVTSLPWGIIYPQGTQAFNYQLFSSSSVFYTNMLPLHPVQIYEALAGFSGAVLCWLTYRYTKKVPGLSLLLLGFWFSAWRWFLFSFRASAIRGALDFQIYPWLYASLLLLMVVIALFRMRQEKTGISELLSIGVIRR